MAWKISCREGVYGGVDEAVRHLPGAGIHHLEINVRPEAELKKAAESCRAAGVTPLTLSGGVACEDPASLQAVRDACRAAKAIGVRLFFLSAHGPDRPAAMSRLRELGAFAADCGVTLCLETHPPFCLNAAEMLKTMDEVNHPNVRVNFDTANIFYYNQGMDSADELPKVIGHVASVHLKDTDGGFKSMNFPVFGEGVVRFPRIFEILAAADFDGPCTMELEGPLLKGLDAAGRHAKVLACMAYLKGIGAVRA
jgi:sugar phosphate isomerase/epimerase